MAFTVGDVLTPTSIGRIDHFLDDLDGTQPNQSLQYNLEILDQFGDVMDMRDGDEAPHLSAQQISDLRAFMNSRRANIAADLSFPAGNTVGRATWRFRDGDGSSGSRSLYLRVEEKDDQGEHVQTRIVDDQPNLSGAMISGAIAFLNAQRTKAEDEVLP